MESNFTSTHILYGYKAEQMTTSEERRGTGQGQRQTTCRSVW
jgi:hypothetical protein